MGYRIKNMKGERKEQKIGENAYVNNRIITEEANFKPEKLFNKAKFLRN